MVREATIEDAPKGALKIEYEPEVDILTIYLQDPETPLSHDSEAEPGLILSYAEDGSLASIEIMNASTRYPPGQLAAHSVDEFIDLKTASNLASIAPVTLRTQAERGRLWAVRLGGQWVTTRERLQQYLDSRSRQSKSPGRADPKWARLYKYGETKVKNKAIREEQVEDIVDGHRK